MNYQPRLWPLQEAKAQLSKVIRCAHEEGPQIVTVHGKTSVRITAVLEKNEPEKKLTGKDFVAAMRKGLKFDLDIPPRPKNGKMRDVQL